MTLQELIQRAVIWRAGELSPARAEPTGFAVLDEVLPGGGWPRSGLTEILSTGGGIGALRLVLPALVRLSLQERWIIWVSPPHILYAPALREAGMNLSRLLIVDLPDAASTSHAQSLWAYEQALRFNECAAAVLWLAGARPLQLRRLQLAAESGVTWGVVFRPLHDANQASPAVLRLGLESWHEAGTEAGITATGTCETGLEVTVLKARGMRAGGRYQIRM